MRRWFLSYNSQDLALMAAVEAALGRKYPDSTIFFAPKSLRTGSYWRPGLTVKVHLHRLYERLDVRNRTALVALVHNQPRA